MKKGHLHSAVHNVNQAMICTTTRQAVQEQKKEEHFHRAHNTGELVAIECHGGQKNQRVPNSLAVFIGHRFIKR